MRTQAFALLVVGLMAPVALDAQIRGPRGGRAGAGGIPPGQLPPAGLCRVWYDGVPPGRQPAPMSCRNAEAIAARDRSARVIYGTGSNARRPQAVPRYPSTGRFPGRIDSRYDGPAYYAGYKDGYDKGLEDADDNDRYDPTRHGRYKSADHGYEREYGSKDEYRIVYRDGFRAGYDAGYRDVNPWRRWP